MNVILAMVDVIIHVLTLMVATHVLVTLVMNWIVIVTLAMVCFIVTTYSVYLCLIFCIDINECVLNIDLCEHTCTNTVGSYQCSCNTGYYLESNGYNCTGTLSSVFIMFR